MNREQFNAAFRNLHLRLSTYEQDEIDQGLSLMRAFCPGCSLPTPETWAAPATRLARRYGEKVLTDDSAPTGSVPGLGTASSVNISIRDYGTTNNRQFGIAQVPASSPDQRRWLRIYFPGVNNPPATVDILGAFNTTKTGNLMPSGPRNHQSIPGTERAWFYAYLGSPQRRAIGHHWVYVYNEGKARKSPKPSTRSFLNRLRSLPAPPLPTGEGFARSAGSRRCLRLPGCRGLCYHR